VEAGFLQPISSKKVVIVVGADAGIVLTVKKSRKIQMKNTPRLNSADIDKV